jgi:hypothetical protein
MKTLNLNKLSLLIGLFLISIAFSSGAQANNCVKDANGVIESADGASDNQVKATNGERTAFTDACTDTPDEYKLTFYKLGLCTADTSFNDLSSCKFIINSAAGIEHTIIGAADTPMAIPEFVIDPGTYPFMVVLISAKLAVKHSFQTSNAADGVTGSGVYCWTSNAGYTGYTSENGVTVTGHGNSTSGGTQMLECGAEAGTAVFTHEVINKLNGDTCAATWVANGDRWPVVDDDNNVETVGNGTAVVNLLTATDGFATSCANVYKILWTTDLTTPYVVTENSSFGLSVKTTHAISLDFDGDNTNQDVIKAGADPVQLFLTVTD